MEDTTEKPEIGNQLPEKSPFSEKGRDVYITLRFIRHGERTPQTTLPSGEKTGGTLTDYGREVTKERARASGLRKEDFDAVKAVGSTAGLPGPEGMPRSLETADIVATEIDPNKDFRTRGRDVLSYETLVTPMPYNHDKVYNESLPKDFNALSDVEKAKASKQAQRAALNHLLSLETPQATDFKREVAGSFAYFIDNYIKMANRLNSNSRVLIPAGTHGGMMEPFLQQVLARHLPNGQILHGFQKLEKIGGEFDPSEAFSVEVATDNNGGLQKLKVTFDNKDRPQEEMYLDLKKLQELKDFYVNLHSKK